MNINSTSSSSYVNNASSSKGFSGLASGMDTESLVEAMLSGTQAKIDKQNALKQQTLWKQEIYRDIISQISSFQSKFFKKGFSDLSSTSLMNSAFFNSMKAVSTAASIRVSVESSAATGSHSVKVSQLATASKVTSTGGAGKHTLDGQVELDKVRAQAVSDSLSERKEVVFTINGEVVSADFTDLYTEEQGTVKGPTTDQVVERLNKSLERLGTLEAKVGADGTISIVSTKAITDDDKGDTIKVSSNSTEAGLRLLGLTAGASASEYEISPGSDNGTPDDPDDDIAAVKGNQLVGSAKIDTSAPVTFDMDITYDGAKATISIDMNQVASYSDFASQFQTQLDYAFGQGKVLLTMDNATGSFQLDTSYATSTVMMSGDNVNQELLGVINGESNRIGVGGELGMYFAGAFDADGKASFTINGKTIEVNDKMTVSEMMRAVNSSGAGVTMSYQSNSGTFALTSNSTGDGFNIDIADASGSLMAAVFGNDGQSTTYTTDLAAGSSSESIDTTLRIGNFVEGKDAIFEFDGTTMARSSNTITQDGLTMTFTATTDAAETITVNRSTDEIVDGIKSFIEEYNALLDKINGLLDEETEYRDYAPLTDAQKKEMSEKEIELWEEKAKTGLLRRDSTLDSFLQSMRSVLYTKPDGCSYAIYDLGIDTGDYTQKGKLVMDADGEAKLRAAIESNPDEVAKLFAGEGGLGEQLNAIINEAANTSSGSPGTLVQIAGVKGSATEKQSEIYQRLAEIEEKIKSLKDAYELEKNRYWSKFNSMETYIAQMSSQSAWLTQQFGY